MVGAQPIPAPPLSPHTVGAQPDHEASRWTAAGSLAGPQDHRVRRCLRGGQHPAPVSDRQATIQALLDLHPGVGIACAVQPWEELEGVPPKADGVIPSYRALVLEAEHAIKFQARE